MTAWRHYFSVDLKWRNGIFKLFRSLGIDSASLCTVDCRAGTTTLFRNRFLASINCSKIPAQFSLQVEPLARTGPVITRYSSISNRNGGVPPQVYRVKVLTNEKRGGLKVVGFDKSPFKLSTLRFSTKSVQAPSCKRPKTTQRALFLSFEINNCFPITV